MKIHSSIFALAIIGSAPLTHGATFFDNFATLGQNTSPSTQGQNLNTYNGWSSANGAGSLPLAYGYTVGLSPAAALGVAFDAPASGTSFSATHTLSTPLAGSTLLTTFAIIDSEAGAFPARNDYSISIAGGLTTLFTLTMAAQSQTQPLDPALWTLSGQGVAFATAQENGLYNLVVKFVQSGANINYNATVSPANGGAGLSQNGTLTGQAAATVDLLRVTTSFGSATSWGSGYLGFDNIGVVPEPSSALLLGIAGLGLLRRRRA